MKSDVLVVGGGSVASSFLQSLIKTRPRCGTVAREIKVVVMEPNALGPGKAYASPTDRDLLTANASIMNVVPEQGHFLRWLELNRVKWSKEHPLILPSQHLIAPRRLFGYYISDTLKTAIDKEAKSKFITISHVAAKAHQLVRLPEGDDDAQQPQQLRWIVNPSSANQVSSKHIVICTGNYDSTCFPHMLGESKFINQPLTRPHIDPDASVTVIGTSLTAVDVIMELVESGHRGQIHAVSRSGLFPAVRSPFFKQIEIPALLRKVVASWGPTDLKTLETIARKEYARIFGEEFSFDNLMEERAHGAQRYLESELAQCQSTRNWQTFVLSLNDSLDIIWNKLTPDAKQVFTRDWRSLFMMLRVSIPMENGSKILSYMESGKLKTFKNFKSVQAPTRSDGKLRVTFSDCTSPLEADTVINATGHSCDVEQIQDEFIQQLRTIVVPDENKLGFAVDYESGCAIDRRGCLIPNVAILGSLTTGTYFFTNAMPVNARLAESLAKRIWRSL